MIHFEKKAIQTLFEQNFITKEQIQDIQDYRSLNLFSVHNELKLLIYLAILLFTSGVGILIYQNIDTIGHTILLVLLLMVTLACFYFCFKNHEGFKKEEVSFPNPLYDYLVLTAVLLSCTFVGYLQFQYQTFGTHYGLATLVPTIISLFCAYYFDNKSVLSIGITGIATYLGLSVDPKNIFENEMIYSTTLSFIGLALALALLLWTVYATKINLKKHFNMVYLTFSLHLFGIVCVANLLEKNWFFYAIILGLSSFYFYTISFRSKSIVTYAFTILYAYIGLNIVLFHFFSILNTDAFLYVFFYTIPFYFIGSIYAFIKLIKQFNTKTSYDSL